MAKAVPKTKAPSIAELPGGAVPLLLQRTITAAFFTMILLLGMARMSDPAIFSQMVMGRSLFEGEGILQNWAASASGGMWLFNLITGFLWQAAPGGILLIELRALLLLCAYLVLFKLLRPLAIPRPLVIQYLIISAFLLHGFYFSLAFSLNACFFIIFFGILRQSAIKQGSGRAKFLLPGLMLLWCNLHQGCAWGVLLTLLWGIYFIVLFFSKKCTPRQLGLAWVVVILTTAASGLSPNPFSWAIELAGDIAFPAWLLTLEGIKANLLHRPLFYFFGVLGSWYLLWRCKKIPLLQQLVFQFFFLATLLHEPLLKPFGLLYPFLLAHITLAAPEHDRSRKWFLDRRFVIATQLAVLFIVINRPAGWLMETGGIGPGVDCRTLPCKSVEFFKEAGLQNTASLHDPWSGYLAWHSPEPSGAPASVDTADFWLYRFPEMQDQAAIAELDAKLKSRIWVLVHFDKTAVVLAKKSFRIWDTVRQYGYLRLRPWHSGFAYLDTNNSAELDLLAGDIAFARARCPEAPLPLLLDANLLIETGEKMRATSLYREGISRFPKDYRFHAELGNLLASEGLTREAVDLYDKASDLGADSAKFLNAYGEALYRNGDIQAARWRFRKAMQTDTSLLAPYRNLEKLAIAVGEDAQANKYRKLQEQQVGEY